MRKPAAGPSSGGVRTAGRVLDRCSARTRSISAAGLIRDALQDSESRYRAVYENVSEGIYRSSLDGRQISANPSLVRLNGYDTEAEMLAAVNDIAREWYVDPNRRDMFRKILHDAGRVVDFVSEIYRHRTRERIWISENAYMVRDRDSDKPLFYEGTVREVTETVRRLELQDRHDKIAAVVPGCIYQIRRGPEGAMSLPYASAGFIKLFGFPASEVEADVSPILESVHPDDLDSFVRSADESARDLSPWQSEFRIRLADGSLRWLFGNSIPEREPDGSTLWNGFITDVTGRKQAEARIHELAFFDPLTKLPNRRLLLDRLGQVLATSRRNGAHGAVLFIDLDDFKRLNDTRGHAVGDQLLVQVAARLSACSRAADTVSRLGGDEFVMLVPDLDKERCAAERSVGAIASKIVFETGKTFWLAGEAFRITPSIGVTLFQGTTASADELMKSADVAMYEAKSDGRNAFRFFRPEMQEKLDSRAALASDLRRGLDEGQFTMRVTAQVDGEGRLVGAEALPGWMHPRRGLLGPDVFLATAEAEGLAAPLGDSILMQACTILARWSSAEQTAGLRLAFKVDASQLRDPEFARRVERSLAASGADPRKLRIEFAQNGSRGITDGCIDGLFRHLRPLGVTFTLDGLGAGGLSLTSLKLLDVDEIKIDPSFLRDLEGCARSRGIVRAMAQMAEALGCRAAADGVASDWQMTFLRAEGYATLQGPLFGGAVTLETFDEILCRSARMVGAPALGLDAGLSSR